MLLMSRLLNTWLHVTVIMCSQLGFNNPCGNFSGSPLGKTPHFHRSGRRFSSWLGNQGLAT